MDFVILSINGKDISNSSHEEAVRCFETAPEPITIQVLRKQSPRTIPPETPPRPEIDPRKSVVSTSVQTDLGGLLATDYVENYYVFEDGDYDYDNEENEDVEDPEFDEIFTNAVDPQQPYKLHEDVYFEEVTLQKSLSTEKLGLTVCYNYSFDRDNSEAAEVYISEIAKDSLAARDGRLREGDQILQVNGKDMESKEQTERVFAQTKTTVVILVSRCMCLQSSPVLSDNLPAYQNSMIEILLQQQKRQYGFGDNKHDGALRSTPPPVPSHSTYNPSSTTNLNMNTSSSTSSSQNSHGSNSNKDCSAEKNSNYGENLRGSMKKIDELCISGKRRKAREVGSDSEHIYETIPESDVEPIYSCPYESRLNLRRNDRSEGGHDRSKSSKSSSSMEEKDSSSAYNTGESCHSNPLVLELQKDSELRSSTLVLCPSDNTCSSTLVSNATSRSRPPPSCDIAENQVVRTIQSSLSAPQFNQVADREEKKGNSCYYHPNRQQYQTPYQCYQLPHQSAGCNRSWDNRDRDSTGTGVMYTNVDNLEQTMMLQQQIFTQALNKKNGENKEARVRSTKRGKFRAPNLTQYHFIGSQQVRQANTLNPQEDMCDPRMEWKVKRRPDGTRYIVRRPVRNRLLGNRTLEISEERAGLTTEDDTVSEIKLGRYWTKDERKRHLEQARLRKQRQATIRQHMKLQQCYDLANCDHVEEIKDSKKNHQEGLITANRNDETVYSTANGKPIVGLLSVTTV